MEATCSVCVAVGLRGLVSLSPPREQSAFRTDGCPHRPLRISKSKLYFLCWNLNQSQLKPPLSRLFLISRIQLTSITHL